MNRQPTPTTTRGRAERAISYIMDRKARDIYHDFPRDFDNCFEMGDGGCVVAIIVERAAQSPALAAKMQILGFGNWLARDKQARLFDAAEAVQ